MEYIKSQKFLDKRFLKRMMGPNALKILEQLLLQNKTAEGSTVCDLGSGAGLTSVFLVKEYGFKVYASDLWSNSEENQKFFESEGLDENQILAVKADAMNLPYDRGFFDAVVSIDSYHYFGRDEGYLQNKLLPFVKPGGYLYIAFPGLKKEFEEQAPEVMQRFYSPEDIATWHDVEYWRNLISKTKGVEILDICQMEDGEEFWEDWFRCTENSYAMSDKAAHEAGAHDSMTFIAMVLKVR